MAKTTSNTPAPEAAPGEKIVKYTGIADSRKILKSDWAKAGVEDQDAVTWDASNGYAVPASDLSAGALAHLDKRDPAFSIKDAPAAS